ncbi:MAG: AAA family ATPase [Nanoarchaeota archaeon]
MLKKIKLQNWKVHKQSEYEFKPGTNVIIGQMGAGKSSILQAISYAIFGTFSELKSKEIKVSDLPTRGLDGITSEVNLSLQPLDIEYNITRTIKNGITSEAVIRNSTGQLLAGTNSMQVTDFLAEKLGLDEDVFLRTAYARQNDIDMFLRLSPGDRKSKLDELMGLQKFEIARRNTIKLANQIAAKRDAQATFLGNFDFQKSRKDIDTLATEISELKQEKANLSLKLAEVEKRKAELNLKTRTLRIQLDNYNRMVERRELYRKQLEEINTKVSSEPDESLDSVRLRLNEITLRIEEVKRAKQHSRDDLERGRNSALEIEKSYGGLEEKNSEIIISLKDIEDSKFEIDKLKKFGDITKLELRLLEIEKFIDETLESKNQMVGEIGVLKGHLHELESVDGACPVCSTRLEQVTKDVLIQERRRKIIELNETITRLENKVEDLKTEKFSLTKSLERQKVLQQKIEKEIELRKKERDIAIRLSELRGRRAALTDGFSQISTRAENLDKEIENLESERRKLDEKKQVLEFKNQKYKLARDLEVIEKSIVGVNINAKSVESAEEQYREIIQELEKILAQQRSGEFLIEEKEKRFRDLNERQEQFTDIEKEVEYLGNKIDFLYQFKNALLAAQEALRKELITAVNEVIGNIWNLIYPYDKWTSVRLEVTDSDYVLQLREYEGEWLNVTGYASGGERIIASLALRIAFTKILTPQLSVLILDEPTHNMDDRAIATFVDVLQNDLSSFLDQIFIITHNEKLAEAGNNVIRL